MTTSKLLATFDDWREQGKQIVLATVFETAGSTYSKAGARMLINADGDYQGMLSGGCLEGDLAQRARQVLDTGKAQMVTYDLGLNDEELWGLGVGCDGLMKIFLQPLLAGADYAPFPAIARMYDGDQTGVAVTILESGQIEPGTTLVSSGDHIEVVGLSDTAANDLMNEATIALASNVSSTKQIEIDDTVATVLFAIIKPRPRLLILGAGLDAEPVCRLASELGWRITVFDHRPAYIDNGDFKEAEKIVCSPAAEMSGQLELSTFDAAIVMSHHLDTDRLYLAQLSTTAMVYIGLLGPKDRRKRLVEDLGEDAASLESRLHGPAGLDIAAVGPAAIALSILAEAYESVAAGGS